jgi:hypothetical protein
VVDVRTMFWGTALLVCVGLAYIIVIGTLHR